MKSPRIGWSVHWSEVASFTPTRVRVGRNSSTPVVKIEYRPGFDERDEPQHVYQRALGLDQHYILAVYRGYDNTTLAAYLEEWRAKGSP